MKGVVNDVKEVHSMFLALQSVVVMASRDCARIVASSAPVSVLRPGCSHILCSLY